MSNHTNCYCRNCFFTFRKKHNEDATIKFIIKRYKLLILSNLDFRVSVRRNYPRVLLSKVYKSEQIITLFEPKYHLIKCKRCMLIKRALINSRYYCCHCKYVSHYEDRYTCYNWKAWDKTII